jgi:hypothetical protein
MQQQQADPCSFRAPSTHGCFTRSGVLLCVFVQLTSKKVELAAALDQLSTLEYDSERLKAQLSKQMKICEGHVTELNKSRS